MALFKKAQDFFDAIKPLAYQRLKQKGLFYVETKEGVRVGLKNGEMHRWVDDQELQSLLDTGKLSMTPENKDLEAGGGFYGRPGHKDFAQFSESGELFLNDLQGDSQYKGSGQHHLILNMKDIPKDVEMHTDPKTTGSLSLNAPDGIPIDHLSLVESRYSKIVPDMTMNWKDETYTTQAQQETRVRLLAQYLDTSPRELVTALQKAELTKAGNGEIEKFLSKEFGKDMGKFSDFVDEKLGGTADIADYNATESARMEAEQTAYVKVPGVKTVVDSQAIGDKLVGQAENSKLLQLYKDAAKRLLDVIQAGDPTGKFAAFRKAQYQEIQKVIAKLDGASKEFAQENTARVMSMGDEETLKKIQAFREDAFDFEFAGVNQRQIDVMAGQAYVDFGKTMRGLQASAQTAVLERASLSDEIIRGAIQGSSFSRTTRDVVQKLKEQGFTVLKTKNGFGARRSLEAYSNMLVRSQNILGFNVGSKARMLGAGRRYAIFPTLRPDIDGYDVCNEWEEKKYVDLLNDDLPPHSTHPNCRHTLQPVSFDQLQKERPDLYEIAIQYFKETSGFTPGE